jgi:c-di-GMP-binding flagellar brake protein YcgR
MVEKVITREERRIFARVPISVEVIAKQGDLPVIKAKTLDISDGGIRLMSLKELPKGRVMELEMNLPMPLTIALGEVVWTRELETKEGKFFQAGIDFTRIG